METKAKPMIDLLINIDYRVFFFINNSWSSRLLDDIFLPLSSLGSWPVLLITAALLAGEGRRKLFLHSVAVLVMGLILVGLVFQLKWLFDRERPLRALAYQIKAGEVDVNTPTGSAPARGKAFPSGHSTMAFYALVYPLIIKRRGAVPLLLLATLIALSRVYLGAHWITDCAGGAALGSLGAAGAAQLFYFLERPGWRPETTT